MIQTIAHEKIGNFENRIVGEDLIEYGLGNGYRGRFVFGDYQRFELIGVND